MKFHEALKFGTPETGIKTFCGPCTVESVGDLNGLTGLHVSETPPPACHSERRTMTPSEYGSTMIDGISRLDCYVRWLINRDEVENGSGEPHRMYPLTDAQIAAAKRYEADCPKLDSSYSYEKLDTKV